MEETNSGDKFGDSFQNMKLRIFLYTFYIVRREKVTHCRKTNIYCSNMFFNNLSFIRNVVVYYALNKIMNSDWLNTNLTLDDVWLVGSNVRQLNLMSGWWRRHVINVIPFGNQCQVSRDVT